MGNIVVNNCGDPESCEVEADVQKALGVEPIVKVFCGKCIRVGMTERRIGSVNIDMQPATLENVGSLIWTMINGNNQSL